MIRTLRLFTASFALTILASCGGGGGGETSLPPPPSGGGTQNSVPTANAGPDQSSEVGLLITLDGTGSSDPDGDTITYAWEFESKPSDSQVSLSDGSAQNPTFTADVIGDYVVNLVVSDGTASSDPDTVTVQISAANQPPVADAGPDQSVTTGDSVTLDGSQSLDPDEDLITYAWEFSQLPDGSAATISDATIVNPTFTADTDGVYSVTLTVSDPDGLESSDSVDITAETANSVPIANAGPDQNVVTNSLVLLDGSASSDADNDGLTYSWEITSKPEGSTAALDDNSSPNPSFTADFDGEYLIDLIVNDGIASSESDTVVITAATINSAPVANAGPDQTVETGATVTLDGSASSDSDGDALTYAWSFTSVPDGSTSSLADATSVTSTFVTDIDGTYVVGLIVNDGEVDSERDSVSISSTTTNSPPTADAGSDQSVTTGDTVSLDGSLSSDPDGDSLTYAWVFTSIPEGSEVSLSDATSAAPTFVADLDGTYVVDLTVSDGAVESAPDTVSIVAATPEPKLRLFAKNFRGEYEERSLPYNSSGSAAISTTAANCTVGEFRLSAEDGDFVITDLSAAATTGSFTVAFAGLSNDQTISDGSTVDFDLISSNSSGTRSVEWTFTVQETGANFRVARSLNCNSAQ
jgi:hypothetical protein